VRTPTKKIQLDAENTHANKLTDSATVAMPNADTELPFFFP
jgi:hypothetical protein